MNDWDDFRKVKIRTGYREETLSYVWQTYCGPWTPITSKSDLLRSLKYIHRYPTYRQCVDDLQYSVWSVSRKVFVHLDYLSETMEEIKWTDRLNPWNHCPHFPKYVTGLVDTTPIRIHQPLDSQMRKLVYNPKYGGAVYKIQIGIDFLGRIILFTGPHFGTSYDAHIWNFTNDAHPVEDWEYLLGDGHYTSIDDFICPPQQPANAHMSDADYFTYKIISHYRARVEHINHSFKSHAMFQTAFRGGASKLSSCLNVTANMLNIELKRYQRYPDHGPWNHW